MKKMEEIENFYDEFSDYQSKVGLNIRHYTVFNLLVENGFKKEHNVLDIGCGIGVFTNFMAKYLRKGKILGTDISPKSIEIAKKVNSIKKKTTFEVKNKIKFENGEKFDIITLIDVLEHIPFSQYNELFQGIVKAMKDKTLILINIPHPLSVEYNREFHPEKLQVIDQSVYLNELTKIIYPLGLAITKFQPFSLYTKEHDSIFIKIEKLKNRKSINKKLNISISMNKLKQRIKAFFKIYF